MAVLHALGLYGLLGQLQKSHSLAGFEGLAKQTVCSVIDTHTVGTGKP